MFDSSEQLTAQLTALTESNEQLLKSKSRLQQDLLSLKKMLALKEQELLQANVQVQQQQALIAEQEQAISDLRQENLIQRDQLVQLNEKLEGVLKEHERLLKRSWLQRLFNRS